MRRPDVPIVGDCRLVIEELVTAIRDLLAGGDGPGRHDGRGSSRISGWREQLPAHLRAVASRATRSSRSSASSSCATRRPTDTILVSGVGQHQMWSSPVLEVRAALHLGELGRPRHDGLLGAGRHRRQGRPPRPHGVGRRRRRLLPDDRPGAGHRRRPSASRSRSPSSTTPTSAWCASGRRCSTTSATARCTCRPTCPTT